MLIPGAHNTALPPCLANDGNGFHEAMYNFMYLLFIV